MYTDNMEASPVEFEVSSSWGVGSAGARGAVAVGWVNIRGVKQGESREKEVLLRVREGSPPRGALGLSPE